MLPFDVQLHHLPESRAQTPTVADFAKPTSAISEPELQLPASPLSSAFPVQDHANEPYGMTLPSHQTSPSLSAAMSQPSVESFLLPAQSIVELQLQTSTAEGITAIPMPPSTSALSLEVDLPKDSVDLVLPANNSDFSAASPLAHARDALDDDFAFNIPIAHQDGAVVSALPRLPGSPLQAPYAVDDIGESVVLPETSYPGLPGSHAGSPRIAPIHVEFPTSPRQTNESIALGKETDATDPKAIPTDQYPTLPFSPPLSPSAVRNLPAELTSLKDLTHVGWDSPRLPASHAASLYGHHAVPGPPSEAIQIPRNLTEHRSEDSVRTGPQCTDAFTVEPSQFASERELPGSPTESTPSYKFSDHGLENALSLPASRIDEPSRVEEIVVSAKPDGILAEALEGLPDSRPGSPRFIPGDALVPALLPASRSHSLTGIVEDAPAEQDRPDIPVQISDKVPVPLSTVPTQLEDAFVLPSSCPSASGFRPGNRSLHLVHDIPQSHPESFYELVSQRFVMPSQRPPRSAELPPSIPPSVVPSIIATGDESAQLPRSRSISVLSEECEEFAPHVSSPQPVAALASPPRSFQDTESIQLPALHQLPDSLPSSKQDYNLLADLESVAVPVDVASHHTTYGITEAKPSSLSEDVIKSLPESGPPSPSHSVFITAGLPPYLHKLSDEQDFSVASDLGAEAEQDLERLPIEGEYPLPTSPALSFSHMFHPVQQMSQSHELVLPGRTSTVASSDGLQIDLEGADEQISDKQLSNDEVSLPGSRHSSPVLLASLHDPFGAALPPSPSHSHYVWDLEDDQEQTATVVERAKRSAETETPRTVPVPQIPGLLRSTHEAHLLDAPEACRSLSTQEDDALDPLSETSRVARSGVDLPEVFFEIPLPSSPGVHSLLVSPRIGPVDRKLSLPSSHIDSEIQVEDAYNPVGTLQPPTSDRDIALGLPPTRPQSPLSKFNYGDTTAAQHLPASHFDSPLISPKAIPRAASPTAPEELDYPLLPPSPRTAAIDYTSLELGLHSNPLPKSTIDSPLVAPVLASEIESIAPAANKHHQSVRLAEQLWGALMPPFYDKVPLPSSPCATPIAGALHAEENCLPPLPAATSESPLASPIAPPVYRYKIPIPSQPKRYIPLDRLVTRYVDHNVEKPARRIAETTVGAQEYPKSTGAEHVEAQPDIQEFLLPGSPAVSPTVQKEIGEASDAVKIDEFLLESSHASPALETVDEEIDVADYLLEPETTPLDEARKVALPEEESGVLLPEHKPIAAPVSLESFDRFETQSYTATESDRSLDDREIELPPNDILSQHSIESEDGVNPANEYLLGPGVPQSQTPSILLQPRSLEFLEPAAKPERPSDETIYQAPRLLDIPWPLREHSPLSSTLSTPIPPTDEEIAHRGDIRDHGVRYVGEDRPVSRGLNISMPRPNAELQDRAETHVIDELMPYLPEYASEILVPSHINIIDKLLPEIHPISVSEAPHGEREPSSTVADLEQKSPVEVHEIWNPVSTSNLAPRVESAPTSPTFEQPFPILETHEDLPVLIDEATVVSLQFPDIQPNSPRIASHRAQTQLPDEILSNSEGVDSVIPAWDSLEARETQASTPQVELASSTYSPASVTALHDSDDDEPTSLDLEAVFPLSPDDVSHQLLPDAQQARPQLEFPHYDQLPSSAEASVLESPSVDNFDPVPPRSHPAADFISLSPSLSSSRDSLESELSTEPQTIGYFAPALPHVTGDHPIDSHIPLQFSMEGEDVGQLPLPKPQQNWEVSEFLPEFEDEGLASEDDNDGDDHFALDAYRPSSPPESTAGPSKLVRFADTHDLREYVPEEPLSSPVDTDIQSVQSTDSDAEILPREYGSLTRDLHEGSFPSGSTSRQLEPLQNFSTFPSLPIPYVPDEGIDDEGEIFEGEQAEPERSYSPTDMPQLQDSALKTRQTKSLQPEEPARSEFSARRPSKPTSRRSFWPQLTLDTRTPERSKGKSAQLDTLKPKKSQDKGKTPEAAGIKTLETVKIKTPETTKAKTPEPVKVRTSEVTKAKTPEAVKVKKLEAVNTKKPEVAKVKTLVEVKPKTPVEAKTKAPVETKAEVLETVKMPTTITAPQAAKPPQMIKTPQVVKVPEIEKVPDVVKTKTVEGVRIKVPEEIKIKEPEAPKSKVPELLKSKAPEAVKSKAPEVAKVAKSKHKSPRVAVVESPMFEDIVPKSPKKTAKPRAVALEPVAIEHIRAALLPEVRPKHQGASKPIIQGPPKEVVVSKAQATRTTPAQITPPIPRRRRSIDTLDSLLDFVPITEKKEIRKEPSQKPKPHRKPIARSVSPRNRKPRFDYDEELSAFPKQDHETRLQTREVTYPESPSLGKPALIPAVASWFFGRDKRQQPEESPVHSPKPFEPTKAAREVKATPTERIIEKDHDEGHVSKQRRHRSVSPVKRRRHRSISPPRLFQPREREAQVHVAPTTPVIARQGKRARSASPKRRHTPEAVHGFDALIEGPKTERQQDKSRRRPSVSHKAQSSPIVPITKTAEKFHARGRHPTRDLSPVSYPILPEYVQDGAQNEKKPRASPRQRDVALEQDQTPKEPQHPQPWAPPVAAATALPIAAAAAIFSVASPKEKRHQKPRRARSEERQDPELKRTPNILQPINLSPAIERDATLQDQSPTKRRHGRKHKRHARSVSPAADPRPGIPPLYQQELQRDEEITAAEPKPALGFKSHQEILDRAPTPMQRSRRNTDEPLPLVPATNILDEPSVSKVPSVSREIPQDDLSSIRPEKLTRSPRKKERRSRRHRSKKPRFVPVHSTSANLPISGRSSPLQLPSQPRESRSSLSQFDEHHQPEPSASRPSSLSLPRPPSLSLPPQITAEQRRYEVELERAARLEREQQALDLLEQKDEEAAIRECERLYLVYKEQVERYEREHQLLDEMDSKERDQNDEYLYQQYLVQKAQDERQQKEIELRDKNRHEDMIIAIEKKKEAERRRREEYERERQREEEERRREYELAQERAAFLEREKARREEIHRLALELKKREEERNQLLEHQRLMEERHQAELQRLANEIQRREADRLAILESKEIAEQQRKEEIQRLAIELHNRELDRAILSERKEDKDRMKESIRREELDQAIVETRRRQAELENQRRVDREVEEESRRRRLAEAAALASLAESVVGSDASSSRSSSRHRFPVAGIDDTSQYYRQPYYDSSDYTYTPSESSEASDGSVRSPETPRQRPNFTRLSTESLHSIALAGQLYARDDRQQSVESLDPWSEDNTPELGQEEFPEEPYSESLEERLSSLSSPETPMQRRQEPPTEGILISGLLEADNPQGLGIFFGDDPYLQAARNILESFEPNIPDQAPTQYSQRNAFDNIPLGLPRPDSDAEGSSSNPLEFDDHCSVPLETPKPPHPFKAENAPILTGYQADLPLPSSPGSSFVARFPMEDPHLVPIDALSQDSNATVKSEGDKVNVSNPLIGSHMEWDLPESRPTTSHSAVPLSLPEIALPPSRRLSVDELHPFVSGIDALPTTPGPTGLIDDEVFPTDRSVPIGSIPLVPDETHDNPNVKLNLGTNLFFPPGETSCEVLNSAPLPPLDGEKNPELLTYLPASRATSLSEFHAPETEAGPIPISRPGSLAIFDDEMQMETRPEFNFDDFESLPDSDHDGDEELDTMFAPPPPVQLQLPASRISSIYSLHDAYSESKSPERATFNLPDAGDDNESFDVESFGRQVWETYRSLPASHKDSTYALSSAATFSREIEQPNNFQLPSPESEGSAEYLLVSQNRRGSAISLPLTAQHSTYHAHESQPPSDNLDHIELPQDTDSLDLGSPSTILPHRYLAHRLDALTGLPASRAASTYEEADQIGELHSQVFPPLQDDGALSQDTFNASQIQRWPGITAKVPSSGIASPYAESLALARSLFGDIPGLPAEESVPDDISLYDRFETHHESLPISRHSSVYFQDRVLSRESHDTTPNFDDAESRPSSSHTIRGPIEHIDEIQLPISRQSSFYIRQPESLSAIPLESVSVPKDLPGSRPTTAHVNLPADSLEGPRDLPPSRTSSVWLQESRQEPPPAAGSTYDEGLPDSRPTTSHAFAIEPAKEIDVISQIRQLPYLPRSRPTTPTNESDVDEDPTPKPSPTQVPRALPPGIPDDFSLPISQQPSLASLRNVADSDLERNLPGSRPTSPYAYHPEISASIKELDRAPIITPDLSLPSAIASPSLSSVNENALALIPRAPSEAVSEVQTKDNLPVPRGSRGLDSITPTEIEEPGGPVTLLPPRHINAHPRSASPRPRRQSGEPQSQRRHRRRRASIQEYGRGSIRTAAPEIEPTDAGIDVHFDQETGTIEVSWSRDHFGEAPTVDISVFYPGDADSSFYDTDHSRSGSVIGSPILNNYTLENQPEQIEASTRENDADLFFSPDLAPIKTDTDLSHQNSLPLNRTLFPEADSSGNPSIGLGIEGLALTKRRHPTTSKFSSLPNRRTALPSLSIPTDVDQASEVSPSKSAALSASVSSVSPLGSSVELPPPSPILQLPSTIQIPPIQSDRPNNQILSTFTEADDKALALLFSANTTPTQNTPQPRTADTVKRTASVTPTPGPSRSGPGHRASVVRRSTNTIEGAYPSPETSPELVPVPQAPETPKSTPRLRRLSASGSSSRRNSANKRYTIRGDLEPLQEGVTVSPSTRVAAANSSATTTPRPGSPKGTPPILTILKRRRTMDPLREEFRSGLDGNMSPPAPKSRSQPPRTRTSSNVDSPDPMATPSLPFHYDNPTTASGSRKGKEKATSYDNGEVFEAYGDTASTPLSPERPISVNLRKRQSLQLMDLESRIRALSEQNMQLSGEVARLHQDSAASEKRFEAIAYKHLQERSALVEALEIRSLAVSERESQIETLKRNLEWYKQEDENLTQELRQLRIANEQLTASEIAQRQQYESKREQLHALSQQHSDLQEQYTALSSGLNDIINQQIADVTKLKDGEIEKLKQELAKAKSNGNKLQAKLNAMNRYIEAKDEVYFARSCGHLFNAVQQWCVKFSKFSDTTTCVEFDSISNDGIKDLVESVVLDNSDVRVLLRDRVRRREVFMAMTMALIWELIFCRYMFGLEAEERKKLKALEEKLNEVGPPAAVHMWRATTLQLLSQRRAFRSALPAATEPVVQEIYRTLFSLLPPPAHLQQQVIDSLRNVVNLAVTLSIDMRTQRAEYFMWEAPDNSIGKPVEFVALRMNNRGNEGLTNQQLENMGATVRVVLFPLVTKRGDENGDGYDVETVIAPMQVLVSKGSSGENSPKRARLES
ncbi:hypothetical protein TWF696_008829 [Orbilia brochopaga]|uniref:Uncharacterized protein n=1 Tax=Orbilia brochopaga TaxID=3140254 RepID=A0AAV9UIW2_9PEZI